MELKEGVLRFRVNRRIILKEFESNRMGTGSNRRGTVSPFFEHDNGLSVYVTVLQLGNY